MTILEVKLLTFTLLYVDVIHLTDRVDMGDGLRGNKWYVVNIRYRCAFVSVLH